MGLYKSTDAGETWQLSGLEDGGQIAQIRIDPRDPNLVYVAVQGHAFGPNATRGVFRSDDAGKTFTLITSDRNLSGRSSYYAHIFADAKDPSVLYSANRDMYGSTDGGVTFKPMRLPHGDDHAMWIDPNDSRVMIVGNDGGATVSVTGGNTWSSQLNQPTGEMYRVTVDHQVPYRVYGALG